MPNMSKRVIRLVVLLCLVTICAACLFSACVQLQPQQAWDMLQTAITNSLKYDIYYYKITDFRDEEVRNLRVNVHADADNNGILHNEDGSYRNYAVRIEELYDAKYIDEQFCGIAYDSKGNNPKNVRIDKDFSDGELTASRLYENVKTEDFIQSEVFAPYTLATQLQELTELTYDDILPNGEKYMFQKTGTVVRMQFSLAPSYFERYEQQHTTPSMFLGSSYVELELSYDRVAKIIVYQKDVLDENLNITAYSELYRFDLVYLGKNISLPPYDADWMHYQP